jgi:hypothetical protein
MFYPMMGHSFPPASPGAAAAAGAAREAREDTELMKHDVERLLMITEALWTFLKKEHGYTDESLTEAIQRIDMRDGKLDGRVAKDAPIPCPYCGKANAAKRGFCIYCGQSLLNTNPFAR